MLFMQVNFLEIQAHYYDHKINTMINHHQDIDYIFNRDYYLLVLYFIYLYLKIKIKFM